MSLVFTKIHLGFLRKQARTRVDRGFTLIEILVVLVIIGIIIGFAVLGFGDFGASRRIETQVEQLQNTMKLAQQQAILESATFGLRICQTSWQFLRFVPPATWQPISNRSIFREHFFAKNMQLILKSSFRAQRGQPNIIINSSGNLTPFTLIIGTRSQPDLLVFSGQNSGKLTLVRGGK